MAPINKAAIVVAERNPFIKARLNAELAHKGFRNVVIVESINQLRNQVTVSHYDVVILDLELETDAEKSLAFVQDARKSGWSKQSIVLFWLLVSSAKPHSDIHDVIRRVSGLKQRVRRRCQQRTSYRVEPSARFLDEVEVH